MLSVLYLDVYSRKLFKHDPNNFTQLLYNIDVQRYKYNPRLIARANDKINVTSRISNRKVFQGLAL